MIEEFEANPFSQPDTDSSSRSLHTPISTTATTTASTTTALFDNIPTVSPKTHHTNTIDTFDDVSSSSSSNNNHKNPPFNNQNTNKNQENISNNQNKTQIPIESLYNNNNQDSDDVYNCNGYICLNSHSNSDIYHIDMGNQSIIEPKTIHIVVANANPYQVNWHFYCILLL